MSENETGSVGFYVRESPGYRFCRQNYDRDRMAEDYAKILLGNCDGDVEHVARDAYYVADQMIEERGKRQ